MVSLKFTARTANPAAIQSSRSGPPMVDFPTESGYPSPRNMDDTSFGAIVTLTCPSSNESPPNGYKSPPEMLGSPKEKNNIEIFYVCV